ncbi:transposase [Wolbachia endosymbiont (group A) of Pherbina coryleti]|uniref:transposase n=1 Tax=Wolbachia endosymbiont (group A) of Pherbina coryleti TaxID=3066153 RepID=UPI003133036F
MLNINNKKAIAVKYSNGVYSDHYGACDLLKEVDFQHAIKALYADRACDRHKFYKLCNEYDIKTKIPPINNAAEHPEIDYMSNRNAAIRLIKLYGEDGMKEWKKEVNYGKRSYIEGFFSRLKQIFGFSFRNKSEINREKELNAICLINSLILVWLNLR